MKVPSANIFKRFDYRIVLFLSVTAIVAGVGFAGILLPKIIEMVMRFQLRITPGTMTRKIIEKVPFALSFRVYIFNITNPDEVTAGGKPIVQELGPYHFDEYKDKVNVIDDKDEDTMEYDYRNTYYFRPDKSGPGLTGNEFVIMPHPLILGMVLSINVDRGDLLPFIRAAMKDLLHDPKDIFFRGRLWDLLYDGIMVDCSSDAFEVSAVCAELGGGDIHEITPINETTFSFSLFGNNNASSIGRFKVLRGKKNILDLGEILEYNGSPEMDAWYEDECNQVSGTDGTIFPPFRTKEEGYTIFIPQMCRQFKTEFVRPSKYDGIKTDRFSVSFDVTQYGEPNCYCREGDKCPPKGMHDLFPCTGAPIFISSPHFYQVDPSVLEKVEGLHPEKEKHEFWVEFYQYAGAPTGVRARGQANWEIVPVEEIWFMKDLQPLYLPMFWFEDGVDMEKKFVNMLKYQLILGLKLQKAMKYGFTLAGILGLVFGAIASYIQINDEQNRLHSVHSVHSAKSDTSLTNPKVQTIEIIGNE